MVWCMQEPHVNTCYKHFYYFVCEFSLIDKKELEPLVCAQFISFSVIQNVRVIITSVILCIFVHGSTSILNYLVCWTNDY